MREVYLDDTTKPVLCPVYEREQLPAGAHFDGPAIVQEHGTTTVMFAGDSCTVAATGELIITVGGVA
jgi:N-methylhydantoinase A